MTQIVMSKAAWQSKLVALGVVEVMAGLAVLLTDYLTALEAGQPVGWIFIAKGALTVILRMLTTQPVTATGGDPVEVET
jgi:uncharacterized membrane protein HdeD (DUF308 family)